MRSARLIAALLLPVFAHASDGVVEINQARAIAGGVTAGDEPGFPVRLKDTGSYLLTGDLVNTDPALHVIVVEADDVNINLNGFSLIGPNSCSGAGANRTCTYTGNTGEPMGDGIMSSFQKGVTIHSGTIRNRPRTTSWAGAGTGKRQATSWGPPIRPHTPQGTIPGPGLRTPHLRLG